MSWNTNTHSIDDCECIAERDKAICVRSPDLKGTFWGSEKSN
jgi:hypothetical protein